MLEKYNFSNIYIYIYIYIYQGGQGAIWQIVVSYKSVFSGGRRDNTAYDCCSQCSSCKNKSHLKRKSKHITITRKIVDYSCKMFCEEAGVKLKKIFVGVHNLKLIGLSLSLAGHDSLPCCCCCCCCC